MLDVASWLALAKAPGIGPVRFQRLMDRFETPAQVFLAAKDGDIPAGFCSDVTLRYLRNPDWAPIEQELRWQEQPQHRVLLLNQSNYPALLRHISDPPPVLYCCGDQDVLDKLQLAMVGSRNPTPTGKENAFRVAKSLSELGMIITSGLAIGIDGQAHCGALAARQATIAVLANGLDSIYPAVHKNLAAQIVALGGALVSEHGLGEKPVRQAFPRRNRILSGLAVGTLVVEATLRSGSLITAEHALNQGREVFAMPGAVNNPLSRGCHKLIRQGGKLVETVEHILEEFVVDLGGPRDLMSEQRNPRPNNKSEYNEMLKYLGFDPVSVDLVIERCGKPAEWVTSQLLAMELQGLVMSLPGGKFVKI